MSAHASIRLPDRRRIASGRARYNGGDTVQLLQKCLHAILGVLAIDALTALLGAAIIEGWPFVVVILLIVTVTTVAITTEAKQALRIKAQISEHGSGQLEVGKPEGE